MKWYLWPCLPTLWAGPLGAALMVYLMAAVLLFSGCGTTIEACYVHPEYGQVCVKYDGKLHLSASLTSEQRLEVKAWLEEQGVKVE